MTPSVPSICAGYWLDAREFYIAAQGLINTRTEISLPLYFLFAKSIELLLKAFLLNSGKDQNLLQRRFGHNIYKLYLEAKANGLDQFASFQQREAGVLEVLTIDYLPARLAYRSPGFIYYLPPIEITEDIAKRLLSGLEYLSHTQN